MLNRLRSLWQTEPARIVTGVVAIVLVVANAFGVILDEGDVLSYVALFLPVLLGGEVIRAKVSPVATDDDYPPDKEPYLTGPVVVNPAPDEGNATPEG